MGDDNDDGVRLIKALSQASKLEYLHMEEQDVIRKNTAVEWGDTMAKMKSLKIFSYHNNWIRTFDVEDIEIMKAKCTSLEIKDCWM